MSARDDDRVEGQRLRCYHHRTAKPELYNVLVDQPLAGSWLLLMISPDDPRLPYHEREDRPGNHLGRRVDFDLLPKGVREDVRQTLRALS